MNMRTFSPSPTLPLAHSSSRRALSLLLFIFLSLFGIATQAAPPDSQELKDPAISGSVDDGKVRITVEGQLGGSPGAKDKLLFTTSVQQSVKVSRDKVSNTLTLAIDILQGDPKEIPLNISGEGEIKDVNGDKLQDWSIRREPGGGRVLLLRPMKTDEPLKRLNVTVATERELKGAKMPLGILTLAPPQPSLLSGFVRVDFSTDLDVTADGPVGLAPVEPKYLPEPMRTDAKPDEPEPLAFQFHGEEYMLPLRIAAADPETRQVVLRDFKLAGTLNEQNAAFLFTATARVLNPRGGTLTILSGGVALTELPQHPDWHLTADKNRFQIVFDKAGDFPLTLKFNATVKHSDAWNTVDFKVAPSALQPIVLQGLPADTKFQFTGSSRPERAGETFTSFLPPDGSVQFAWKTAVPEAEGKLFYSAEMLSQISVAPGLMRQVSLIDCKVMQGELDHVTLLLHGAGEVTRVAGEQVLAWKVEPGSDPAERKLVVQFNQAQKNQFSIQVHTQTPIGAFPQTIDALQLRPEGATRFAGYVRIVNQGAVRLEVAQAKGLSQISPEQFPESDATRALLHADGAQRFAYRFSGADFALRIQADQILPELTVSQLLAYNLGETEQAIDTEIEFDIREAPLRELLLTIPRGYAIARLNAAGLSDYFVRNIEGAPAGADEQMELRLVYAQPISGRQVIVLRLERNQPLGAAAWALPRVDVSKAKSVRGHVAVSADAGFRLTAEKTQGLTEIATAFFPRKVPGIQSAFRISEAAWQASLRVERLPQSIQADAFHLFSIGEGVAYGSSLINYVVSGAPIAVFRVELSDEYFNVEFTGKDIRSWQKVDGGYVVQLHTPVSGAYSLLGTYERPFKAQGETLTFTGARPLDAQTEQGHTLIISAYQFQVKPVDVSAGLLPLETGEVPAEYRLFFDAPVLAAYHYTARPFNLKLALSPLAQGDSLSQVADRATLSTRISKEGQVLTDAQYFVKSRGNAHFRVTLPEGTELWSATVNNAPVVPVKDGSANLIPLPQQADCNAVLAIHLQLAERTGNSHRVKVATPVVGAPVLLAEWKLEPDTAQRLIYREGTLTPVAGVVDVSGFAQLGRLFTAFGTRSSDSEAVVAFVVMMLMIAFSVFVWRGATVPGVTKGSARFWVGLVLGTITMVVAGFAFAVLADRVAEYGASAPAGLEFLAPVQQAGQALTVEVSNVEDKSSIWRGIGYAWPVLFAVVAWGYSWLTSRPGGTVLGWTLAAWATLRCPNGAVGFLYLGALFVLWVVIVPALRRFSQLPRRTPAPPAAAAAATTALILFSLLGPVTPFGPGTARAQGPEASTLPKAAPVAETVTQQVRVEDKYALATAKIHWQATKGQQLPLLYEPAVLTQATYPNAALKLVSTRRSGLRAQVLLALETGAYDIELQYQVPVSKNTADSTLVLPTQFGLVNEVTLTLVNLDVDVTASQAVSIDRKTAGKDTVAKLVLSPDNQVSIAWKPRSRDVTREKAVFYAELTQLYTPTAGVIEGLHQAFLRPAQGELSELIFDVPKGATITDVVDPVMLMPAEGKGKPARSVVQQWRFDPDTGKLRVNLSPAQSRPFTLYIRSQVATGPLPVKQSVGLISVEGAAGQIGVLGVATGSEVQLDNVNAPGLSPINLEDFPGNIAPMLGGQIPGITVHRAFRYSEVKSTAELAASAVEPDVRVESQDTLSLGEDRTLLAVNATVDITRAGIFKLSFVLPTGMDIESIEGQALSHWTESKTEAGRLITMHLRGRTQGQQQFNITLAGTGLKAAKAWTTPQVLFQEASKQRGTFLVVPEQGMRLQVTTRDGLTQLDPQKSGIKQKGVLAFRVLQTPWSLAIDIEQVDAWVQVNSLQHATIGDAQVKIVANLQYQIENTGLKAFHVALPIGADNVRFSGDQVADFLPVPNSEKDGMQTWEVKLRRRMIGQYLLQAAYQVPVPANATEISLRGVQAGDVNLQRGFVTVQTGGRLQVRIDAPPAALQPTEWQSIPRVLQKDLTASSASFAYRLVEPGFTLPMKLERHEAAKLLPARVNSITFTSVISDNGTMLTQVRLDMIPGDKRLLHLTLPKGGQFWFAFVNQNGVWPWREGDQILIPLEQQTRNDVAIPVSLFYSSQIGEAGTGSLDLKLQAPKFDLPLENITWKVFLNEKWHVKRWTGSLQLQGEQVVSAASAVDVQGYLQGEATHQREKTKAAEEMLALGNNALAQGDPQQARRAFESAFGLSQHDNAFNEDARVQLHNLKLQQALVGLNVRNNTLTGAPDPLAGKLRGTGGTAGSKDANYTQQDAKDQMGRNTADDNAAFMRLAERLIQQQDAAVSNPATIQATIPEQGRELTFSRSVAVDNWADLQIGLEATAEHSAGWFKRILILLGTALILGIFVHFGRSFRTKPATAV